MSRIGIAFRMKIPSLEEYAVVWVAPPPLSTEAGPGDSGAMNRSPKRPLCSATGATARSPPKTPSPRSSPRSSTAPTASSSTCRRSRAAPTWSSTTPRGDGAAPRLRDVLAGLPRGIYLDVELKGETLSPADCPRILAELTAAGVTADRLMISSFDPELLPPWKAWGIDTALLLGSEATRMGVPRLVGLIRRIGPTWLNPAVQAFDVLGRAPRARAAVRFARLSGLRLAFWTVNTDAQLRSIAGLADIVIGDDVDRAVAFFPKAPTHPVTGVTEAIAARYSCRTFDGRPLAASERSRVEELLAGPHDVPFGSQVRFALLDAAAGRGPGAARLGTYGIIRGAPGFLAGAVREGPGAREDFGFALERIVLAAHGHGAGHLLAGRHVPARGFRRTDRPGGQARSFLPSRPSAIPPPAPRRSTPSFGSARGSSRRRTWEELFTVSREEAAAWAPCLEAVRLGPSATNGQPWRIAKEPGTPVFHLGLAGPAGSDRPAAGRGHRDVPLRARGRGARSCGRLDRSGRRRARPSTRSCPPATVHVASWFPA